MNRALMVMGTGSDVGKSVVAAGLCRIFHRAGINVAPFKAQNMSLNSFVTVEGGEMGRAQVLQAQACGLLPHVDMNPILLKPETDNCSQVVVQGKVWSKCNAKDYFARHEELLRCIEASYQRLSSTHDLIVIEGAGSAAEVNLRDKDIVNWPVAKMADAGVLLVADIDRGGVFAQVIGTLDLLAPQERRRVVGLIINKFRGDPDLFIDGVSFLEQHTHLPVLGVIPFCRDLELDQEDSVEIERYRHTTFTRDKVNVAVVLLPHMSNFTDFNPLVAESDVALRYVRSPSELVGADVVILPGSKTTIADLNYLEQARMSPALEAHISSGGELLGICGGYQMLGREIFDPFGVEGGGKSNGLGLLDVITALAPQKRTLQVEARPLLTDASADCTVRGYELHMGQTKRGKASPCFQVLSHTQENAVEPDLDGAMSNEHFVWGTYIHGVFDRAGFRRLWLNRVRKRKGLAPLPIEASETVTRRLSSALDKWADHLARHLNLTPIFDALPRRCVYRDSKINL